jgi:hypothetical protein
MIAASATAVIASEAKQSMRQRIPNHGLLRFARNDGAATLFGNKEEKAR